MPHGNVPHQSSWRASMSDSREDVVGISWKPVSGGHSNASLVVTCDHQVIVYKPGESRRVHQWSFKPSPTTSFSNATVFLPSSTRYVGVQCGSRIVSWRETEADIKEPLSVKADGDVQAVHGCPKLGDVFVVVLVSGTLGLYQGTLRRLARYGSGTSVTSGASKADKANDGDGDDGDGIGAGNHVGTVAPAPWIVWSGVRGTSLYVLEECGDSTRIKTYAMSVLKPGATPSNMTGQRQKERQRQRQRQKERQRRCTESLPEGDLCITLLSSHVLDRPGGSDITSSGAIGKEEWVCSAEFLGEEGSGDLSLAWRCTRGPFWTRVSVSSSGVRQEVSRRPGLARSTPVVVPESPSDSIAESYDQKQEKTKFTSFTPSEGERGPAGNDCAFVHGRNFGDDAGMGAMVPTIAAADGGRLLVHSGGTSPRLALWDANYGVLLVEDKAPECCYRDLDADAGPSREKRFSMVVSGDGAHVALCADGRVITCPLPSRDSGSLACLLRRKRPAAGALMMEAEGQSALATPTLTSFASLDLTRSSRAAHLLARTGELSRGDWEEVVAPFEAEESETIRSLEEAAHRKDGAAFERVLVHAAGTETGLPPDAIEGVKERESRKRRRGASGLSRSSISVIRSCSSKVLNTAVFLCLANPGADLWNALSLLVKSGGVSARHHRGLVTGIVGRGPLGLLEEVMLHVPDLPEADAVRILRYLLLQAASSLNLNQSHLSKGKVSPPSPSPNPMSVGVGTGNQEEKSLTHMGESSKKHLPTVGNPRDVGPVSTCVPEKNGVPAIVEGVPSLGRIAGVEKKFESHDHGGQSGEGGREKDEEDEEEQGGGQRKRQRRRRRQKETSPHKLKLNPSGGKNGVIPNGKWHPPSDGSHVVDDPDRDHDSSESGGVAKTGLASKADGQIEQEASTLAGGEGARAGAGLEGAGAPRQWKNGGSRRTREPVSPAVRAERGVRVALTLPYNEAFLRSALEMMELSEVVVFLKILVRILVGDHRAEGVSKTRPLSPSHSQKGYDDEEDPIGNDYDNDNDSRIHATHASRGLPPARTEAVLAWASALIDAHFVRLALEGSLNEVVCSSLNALGRLTRKEIEGCERLSEVQALMLELDRRRAATERKSRSRSKAELYSIQEFRF